MGFSWADRNHDIIVWQSFRTQLEMPAECACMLIRYTLNSIYKSTQVPSLMETIKLLYHQYCYDMEVGENRVRVFYGTEKREGERLEIYTGQ